MKKEYWTSITGDKNQLRQNQLLLSRSVLVPVIRAGLQAWGAPHEDARLRQETLDTLFLFLARIAVQDVDSICSQVRERADAVLGSYPPACDLYNSILKARQGDDLTLRYDSPGSLHAFKCSCLYIRSLQGYDLSEYSGDELEIMRYWAHNPDVISEAEKELGCSTNEARAALLHEVHRATNLDRDLEAIAGMVALAERFPNGKKFISGQGLEYRMGSLCRVKTGRPYEAGKSIDHLVVDDLYREYLSSREMEPTLIAVLTEETKDLLKKGLQNDWDLLFAQSLVRFWTKYGTDDQVSWLTHDPDLSLEHKAILATEKAIAGSMLPYVDFALKAIELTYPCHSDQENISRMLLTSRLVMGQRLKEYQPSKLTIEDLVKTVATGNLNDLSQLMDIIWPE